MVGGGLQLRSRVLDKHLFSPGRTGARETVVNLPWREKESMRTEWRSSLGGSFPRTWCTQNFPIWISVLLALARAFQILICT